MGILRATLSTRPPLALCVLLVLSATARSQSQTERAWIWTSGSSTVPCFNCGQSGVYGTLATPASGNIPGGRSGVSTWIDASGSLWLFGGQGVDSAGTKGAYLNDLWELNLSTREWTWMGGSNTAPCNSSGFCGVGGVYGTLGTPSAGDVPGGRYGASSWTDGGGNLWMFGGHGFASFSLPGRLGDLWEYKPTLGEWTWISGNNTENGAGVYGVLGTPAAANAPGGRLNPSTWIDNNGNLWVFGGNGVDGTGQICELNDLWEFNFSSGQWVWVSGSNASQQFFGGRGVSGVYGTLGVAAPANVPGGRDAAASWVDSNGNLWLFGGNGYDSTGRTPGALNDLWMFSPSNRQWTWMDGSSVAPCVHECGQPGAYGTLGTPAPGNTPGGRYSAASWRDSSGNFWLFGGYGMDSAGTPGQLNDVWNFNPSTKEWTWMNGSNTVFCFPRWYLNYVSLTGCGQAGVYGVLGTAAAANVPGARISAGTWIDGKGDLWLFGGLGDDSTGQYGFLNDLWEDWTYQTSSTTLPAATPMLSVGSGNYTSPQVVSISDVTIGAVIYFTTDGTIPTTASTQYTGAITVNSTTTIEAIAVAPGYAPSAVASATYSYTQAAPPTFAPSPNIYPAAQSVALTDSTPNAVIYYTTDGSTPTTNSPVYSSAITVRQSTTINAIAVATGYANSATATATYTIGIPPVNKWVWVGGGEHAFNRLVQYGTLGTPAAGNLPGVRRLSNSWTDASGNLWLFGGSAHDALAEGAGNLNDMWEFSLSTNEWAWMGGSTTFYCDYGPEGYGCGRPGVYGTLGTPAAQNVPGGRYAATSWTDSSGNFWLFGGSGYDSNIFLDTGYLNDLWEFNPASREWTWMGGSSMLPNRTSAGTPGGIPGVYGTLGTPAPENAPGGRSSASSWTDVRGNLWLFGGFGLDSVGALGYLNDLWEFDLASHEWTWMGGSSTLPNNSTFAGAPGVYGTLGVPAPGNIPGARLGASGWTDSAGNFWLFGGQGFQPSPTQTSSLNDLWEFNPSTREWTWMGGSSAPPCNSLGLCGAAGVYGSLGTPAPGNAPGGRVSAVTWTDAIGNFWLFGGIAIDSAGIPGEIDDLWEYNPLTQEWTWMSGFNVYGHWGIYGTMGVPAAGNIPGGRFGSMAWTDKSGNFWLMGGDGDGLIPNFDNGYLNDLWEYQPDALPIMRVATPTFNVPAGTYITPQTVTISDATPGSTIYYTTNGTAPTASSTPYSGVIAVNSTQTIEAIATAGGQSPSALAAATYTITPPAATPMFSIASGTYTSVQTVTISDATPGAKIYYTTDGTTPTTTSTQYTGPLTVNSTETINAIATASGYSSSAVATANYTITVPLASVSLASLTFGAQIVTTSSAAQTVTLSNGGNVPLSISSIAANANFTQTNNCGSSLAANNSCAISVTFMPTTSGALSGTLTITDNADGVAGSTQTVALSGTGQDFSFGPASGSSTSASVAPGQTATYTLSLAGQGGLSGTVSFAVTGAPSEATCTASPNPASLGTNVTVTCTTTAPSLILPQHRPLPPLSLRSLPWNTLWILALLLMSLVWASARQHQLAGRRWASIPFALGVGLLLIRALAGCGGGGGTTTLSNPGTPSGTYSLKVMGTVGSGSSSLSHSITLTLTVN